MHMVNKLFLKHSRHSIKIPRISTNLLSCMLPNTNKKQILLLVQSPTSSPSRDAPTLQGKMAFKLLQMLMSLYHSCLISNFKSLLIIMNTSNLLELKLNLNSNIIIIPSASKHASLCLFQYLDFIYLTLPE